MRLNPVLAHNLLLRAELVRIARRLAAAEIDFAVLKGVVLLQRVYGRLDARPVSDNDLLFRSADLERALAVLGELGYEPKVQQALPDALEGDAKYVLERRYHGRPLWLDLHTSALVPTIHRATEEPFWAHTETVQLDDVSLRVFSPELTLLHLVAHAEQHRFCEPRILQDVIAAWNTWTRRDAASDATASDTPASAPGATASDAPASAPAPRTNARSVSPSDTGARIDEGRLLGLAARLGLWHALDYTLSAAAELGALRTPPPFMGSPRARRLARILPPSRLLEPAPPHGAEAYARALATFLLRDPDRVVAQLRKDVLPPLSKLAVIHDRPVSPLLYLHYATRPLRPVARLLGWRPPPPATHAPEGIGGPPRTGPPQGSLDSAHGQGPWTGSARAVRPAP